MIIYDDIFSWEGFGGELRLGSGKCRLRIFDLKKSNGKRLDYIRPIIVVVSDIPGNTLTIKSCSGHIATKVTREFNIDPSRMLYVEYFPAVIYGEKNEKLISTTYSNFLAVQLAAKQFNSVISDCEKLFQEVDVKDAAADPILWKPIYQYISALLSQEHFKKAEKIASVVFDLKVSNSLLIFDLSATMVYFYSVIHWDPKKCLKFAIKSFELAKKVAKGDPAKMNMALNNLIFALAENGRRTLLISISGF